MASSSTAPTTADTLITLKISFDGITRRFKLPLRDLGAHCLEDKLRAHLHVPVGTATTFERYSDSAASFVVLQPNNVSVYKQLLRAAKAKQKLKLRVTTIQAEPKEIKIPKPVTIEDVPEFESGTTEPTSSTLSVAPVSGTSGSAAPEPPLIPLDSIIAPQHAADFPAFIKEWHARDMPRIRLRRNSEGVEVIDFMGSATPSEPLVTLEPLGSAPCADPSSGQYQFSKAASKLSFAELMREAREQKQAESANKSEHNAESETAAQAVKNEAEREKQRVTEDMEACSAVPSRPFTVCCNSCDRSVPDAHFHCSICDDGDFDLCQDCVNRGITCYGEGHWLIKRTIADGRIKASFTHIAPKSERSTASKSTSTSVRSPNSLAIPLFSGKGNSVRSRESGSVPSLFPGFPMPIRSTRTIATPVEKSTWSPPHNARTCNCCVQEFPEQEFVHCTTCDDYDLCRDCFTKKQHGHHPKHAFVAAVKGADMGSAVFAKLSPGRNVRHEAICDGCDKHIYGVRHKCLECPDWDYCSECVQDAGFIHIGHRFAPIYEPLADVSYRSQSRSTHYGICCDGPLCVSATRGSRYIVGERYKCAVCHDTDFCANCEASPANTHNKTHPLIKFKTPVRHVSVTTNGEHEDGRSLPLMGDRIQRRRTATRSTETISSHRESIAPTPVKTVVDVQPTEQEPIRAKVVDVEIKSEAVKAEVETSVDTQKSAPPVDLVAVFKRDTVADGSILPPNHTFEQTWVLRNEGTTAWPAGCSVKFVGGDYMGAVDPTHPAGIHELVSASESTVCYDPLYPGREFPFTVLMRTPDRDGKVISYWRLTTSDGTKFGHKLWCDVTVKGAPKVVSPIVEREPSKPDTTETQTEMAQSQMVIPRLEHESPSGSVHGMHQAEVEPETETETDTAALSTRDEEEEDFEDCGDGDEWADDSDDGFMTDEEYDILDASDEESH